VKRFQNRSLRIRTPKTRFSGRSRLVDPHSASLGLSLLSCVNEHIAGVADAVVSFRCTFHESLSRYLLIGPPLRGGHLRLRAARRLGTFFFFVHVVLEDLAMHPVLATEQVRMAFRSFAKLICSASTPACRSSSRKYARGGERSDGWQSAALCGPAQCSAGCAASSADRSRTFPGCSTSRRTSSIVARRTAEPSYFLRPVQHGGPHMILQNLHEFS